MFSNQLFALGMLGAMILGIEHANAMEDLHLQQTTVTTGPNPNGLQVEESATGNTPSASSPGRFAQGMNFIKSGIMSTFGRVTGGRFGNRRDTETQVAEVAPSTHSKTTYPSEPTIIENVPSSSTEMQPTLHSPKLEEFQSNAVFINENELGSNKVIDIKKNAISTHEETPPIAHLSELEEPNRNQLLHDNDLQMHWVNVETHISDSHLPIENLPIAYPSESNALEGDQLVHSSPLEVIDSNHVQELDDISYNNNVIPENMKNQPIAYPSKSDELVVTDQQSHGDDSSPLELIDSTHVQELDDIIYNNKLNVIPENMKSRPIAYPSKLDELEAEQQSHGDDSGPLQVINSIHIQELQDNNIENGMPENMKNRPFAYPSKSGEIDSDLDPLVLENDNNAFDSSNNVTNTVPIYAEKLPTPYQSESKAALESHQLFIEEDTSTIKDINYEQESYLYDKNQALTNSTGNQPIVYLSETKELEDEVQIDVESDISYNERNAGSQQYIKNSLPIADSSKFEELEHDRQLSNENNVSQLDLDDVTRIKDTSTSEKIITSTAYSSELEMLENNAMKSEEEIIHQLSHLNEDESASSSPPVRVPLAHNSDVREENNAFISTKVFSETDQSRMTRESENVSSEDTIQFTDVVHLQDQNQYRKTGAYTSTEIDEFSGTREESVAYTSSKVPLTILPLGTNYSESGEPTGIPPAPTAHTSKLEENENIFEVEEKNIKDLSHHNEDESSSFNRVSGADYHLGLRTAGDRELIHTKIPEAIAVS